MPNRTAAAALPIALILTAAGCGSDDGPAPAVAPAPPAAVELSCAELAGRTVAASEIGLPTTGARVTSAQVVAPTGTGASARPEYGMVSGTIAPVDPVAPNIRFDVAMPTAWNGKVLMLGGGGLDGTVPNVVGNVSAGPTDQPLPIARGYAVFGSDSGHQAGPLASLDGAF